MDEEKLQTAIIDALNRSGPLLGKELQEQLRLDSYIQLWHACFQSQIIQRSHFARYYLRFDMGRDNLVRLSPSILRDFLSFTLLSLPHQRRGVIDRQILLSNEHHNISLEKTQIAQEVLAELPNLDRLADRMCAFIAGDLAYFLGHNEPRASSSSGELLQGSDIDIVILVQDDVEDELIKEIDAYMLRQKHYLLKHPRYRQELDFVTKPIEKMMTQMSYVDIHEKIACKILNESMFLMGSLPMYLRVKRRLQERGVIAKLNQDFLFALEERTQAMHHLLKVGADSTDQSVEQLFYFAQERVEFT